MSDAGLGAVGKVTRTVPTAAQARIISAALELFASNGVGGTSLQMIADTIGVTKAAVYHQYNTKDQIVLAAAEAELARLERVIDAAEAESSATRAREALVTGIIDLAVAHRHTVSTILNDPVIVRFFSEHESFRHVMDRMSGVLMGDKIGHEERVDGDAHRRYQRHGHAPTRRRTRRRHAPLPATKAGPTPAPRHGYETTGVVALSSAPLKRSCWGRRPSTHPAGGTDLRVRRCGPDSGAAAAPAPANESVFCWLLRWADVLGI